MENQVEIWKSYPDIPEIEVSTLGRVRTRDRMVSGKGNGTRFQKGRVLKQFISNSGYMRVNIKIDGKQIKKSVHRLVAQTFIENPNDLPMVNHLDCDRKNNDVENLEWCNNSYNQKYREEFGKASGRPVFAVNLATLEVSRFRSRMEAGRSLGVFYQSISKVIKGRFKQTGGYWFTNADDNADDAINRKLYEIGKTGLNIR